MFKGKLKALVPHGAGLANALCLTRRATLFREERIRIRLRTQRLILPLLFHRGEQVVETEPLYKGIPLTIIAGRCVGSAKY